MLTGLFRNVTGEEKNNAIESIIQHATPNQDFFLMLILSVAMAAFGILLDSAVVIVGSMLIAPLLFPLFSFSLGVIMADDKLIFRSLYTLAKSLLYSVVAGAVIGFLFSSSASRISSETLLSVAGADASYSLLYAVVAAVAGFAGAVAVAKPRLNETVTGVAISVSLVPPLAAAGVELSLLHWTLFREALLVFFINAVGIIFSAMIVFALLQFAMRRNVAERVIEEEDKIAKKESPAAS